MQAADSVWTLTTAPLAEVCQQQVAVVSAHIAGEALLLSF